MDLPLLEHEKRFAFTLNFVLYSPCCGRFSFDAMNHMDYNGLLLTAQYFAVCQSPEVLSLNFEKIPDITVRLLLVIVECFGFLMVLLYLLS